MCNHDQLSPSHSCRQTWGCAFLVTVTWQQSLGALWDFSAISTDPSQLWLSDDTGVFGEERCRNICITKRLSDVLIKDLNLEAFIYWAPVVRETSGLSMNGFDKRPLKCLLYWKAEKSVLFLFFFQTCSSAMPFFTGCDPFYVNHNCFFVSL